MTQDDLHYILELSTRLISVSAPCFINKGTVQTVDFDVQEQM